MRLRFSDWPFAVKFFFPSAVAILAVVAMLAVFFIEFKETEDKTSGAIHETGTAVGDIINRDFAVVMALNNILDSMQTLNGDVYRAALDKVIARTPNKRAAIALEDGTRRILADISSLSSSASMVPEDAGDLAAIHESMRAGYLESGVFDILAGADRRDSQDVASKLVAYQEIYDETLASIYRLSKKIKMRAEIRAGEVDAYGHDVIATFDIERGEVRWWFILIFFLSASSIAGVAFLTARAMARSVVQIAAATQHVADGGVNLDLAPLRRKDELEQIVDALDVFLENNIKIEQMHKVQELYIDGLKQAEEKAQAMALAKNEFLANMSHELRTPLNTVLGMIQMVLAGLPKGTDAHVMLSSAQESGALLVAILNDIMDLTKIEADKFELQDVTFNLRENIQKILNAYHYAADDKNLIYECVYTNDDHPLVTGDQIRFSQILTNLVGNAIKFTPMGSVSTHIDWFRAHDDTIQVRIEVKDTGIGISSEHQAVIFEKFSQADNSISRKFGGSGLGLTITKKLVDIMGGTISLRSEISHGTVFTVTIPFGYVGQAEIAAAPPEMVHAPEQENTAADFDRAKIPVQTIRVLVAEDHPMNKLLIERYLKKIKVKSYKICENGLETVDAFRDHKFDLVFMDCHMPVMTGYEATEKIRHHEAEVGGHVPIIAMTADAMAGTRERCLASGMDEYISKPLDINSLNKLISQWVDFDEKAEVG